MLGSMRLVAASARMPSSALEGSRCDSHVTAQVRHLRGHAGQKGRLQLDDASPPWRLSHCSSRCRPSVQRRRRTTVTPTHLRSPAGSGIRSAWPPLDLPRPPPLRGSSPGCVRRRTSPFRSPVHTGHTPGQEVAGPRRTRRRSTGSPRKSNPAASQEGWARRPTCSATAMHRPPAGP